MGRIKIEDAIADAGLKKKYVAERLGIHETYLNTYLSSPEKISVENASILCGLTGKKMDELDFGQSNYFNHKLQNN